MMFFSEPFSSESLAKAAYEYDLFKPALVVETPDGYVLAYPKVTANIEGAAARIKELLSYKVVAVCDSLMGVWSSYPAQETEHDPA